MGMAIMRAITSVGPPAANGTIRLMARSGNAACPKAGVQTVPAKASINEAAAAVRGNLNFMFMVSPGK